MNATVSKERKRKAKRKHKLAERDLLNARNQKQRPLVSILAVFATWSMALVVFRLPALFALIPGSRNLQTDYLPDALLGAAACFITSILVLQRKPQLAQRNSSVILLNLICILSALYSALILHSAAILPSNGASGILPFWLPTIFAPLLATLLLGAPAGIAAGLFASLIMAIYAEQSFPIAMNGLIATVLIAHLVPTMRTRSKVIKTSLYIGLVQLPVFALLAWQMQSNAFRFEIFAVQLLASIAAAGIAALLVLLLLPLLEHVFNISTNISLLEFSDLGHPLLQRLALEAPGTYHHSLVVANIAQAAAEAIGANSLEARVSAYFHDIGKLTKPEFFAENMFSRPNPHDQLAPTMSTLIITAHVKEGLSMAQLHKLPVCVHRAILEHHGSSILQCFHHKAMTSQQEFEWHDVPARPLDESQFRYPGPRPSTRISAIICLADAVEAASRCIAKPTPANLKDLVHDIVRKRLDDGQLDQCELSLLELSQVKRAFVFTLANMLHGRVTYPENHENRNTKPSAPAPDQQAQPAANDPEPVATCTRA